MIALSFAPIRGEGACAGSQAAHGLLEELVRVHWPHIPFPLSTEKTKAGKPCFPDFPQCQFNLSHSGEWAVCTLDSTPVGVDLQQHRRVPLRVIEKFTREEQDWLAAHPQDFFDLWVKKEAFLKATGAGLTRRLDSFSVLPIHENCAEGYRITLVTPPEKGYSCAVCTLLESRCLY